MKKLCLYLSLFLFLFSCASLYAYADEGFHWVILSDENDNGADNASGSSEEKEDDEDEEEAESGDTEKEHETKSDDTEKEHETENEEQENGQEESGGGKEGASRYPDKTIYSQEEIEEMIRDKYEELEEAYEITDKFEKAKAIDSIDSFILNFCGDPLSGKTLVFLGDSITAGNGGTLTPDGSGLNYTDFISNYTSAKIVNLGIGGTPFDGSDNDDAIVNRYEDIPENADIIVLFGGINDLFAGAEHFGSLEDPQEGTYCGDIKKTFEQIAKRHPDADIYVVITYPNKMEEYREYMDENWQDYADVQIELADEYDFHIINLYQEGFLDSSDSKVRNAFFKDDIHPDDLGSEVLGRHILVHLLRDDYD